MFSDFEFRVTPGSLPPLDESFKPAVLANQAFRKAVADSGVGVPLVIGVARVEGAFSRFETTVFPEDHPAAEQNLCYIERLVKFLLWQRGGWQIYIGGPEFVGNYIKSVYSADGKRAFDYHFMTRVYLQTFSVIICSVEDVPAANETQKALGRHLSGNRIGFDLGASDLKVSAVVDGVSVFSTEIEWQPVEAADPGYHRGKIEAALELAASKLPKVEAVGGSSAGVYVNNRPMVASLFRSIPDDQFDQIRNMFLEIRDQMGVPFEIVNDGEVTALAGSMAMKDNGFLGIAMGSSEATGYVNMAGNITDWLNELAFAPVDYQEDPPLDEWSGDVGCGALYFSQQCVFRLAPKVGIDVPDGLTNAKKLKHVQAYLEEGHEGAINIWKSIGVYLGYTIAHYAEFYEIKNVMILGRVTSGQGGQLILDGAREVLSSEFQKLNEKIQIMLPDEKFRRVGQSIAAASLPQIG